MTMPKFVPVARLIPVNLPAIGECVWARTFDEYSQESSSSNPYMNGEETPLYTADQLTEAYEAGKRDAIPEGWVLVPKKPTDKMVEAANTLAQGTGRWISIYKAMIAAAPKGEE